MTPKWRRKLDSNQRALSGDAVSTGAPSAARPFLRDVVESGGSRTLVCCLQNSGPAVERHPRSGAESGIRTRRFRFLRAVRMPVPPSRHEWSGERDLNPHACYSARLSTWCVCRFAISGRTWYQRRDSNPRPSSCKDVALATELRGRVWYSRKESNLRRCVRSAVSFR